MDLTRSYDDSPGAWRLRDATVTRMAEKIRGASTIELCAELSSYGLGYVALAAQTGQEERLRLWALELGAAQDEALARLTGA